MTVKWTIDMVRGVLVVREYRLSLFCRVSQRVPIVRPKVTGSPECCLHTRLIMFRNFPTDGRCWRGTMVRLLDNVPSFGF